MEILFVIPEYKEDAGGIATYYTTLIPAIAARGHSVDVLVGSAFTNEQPSWKENGVRVRYLETDRRQKNFERFHAYEAVPSLRRTLAAAWGLFEQADRGAGYDVVEATDFGLLFLPWVAFNDTPPTLVQLHASNGQIDAHEPTEGQALQGHLTRLLELRGLAQAEGLQGNSHMNIEAWETRLDRDVRYCPPPLALIEPSRQGVEVSEGSGNGSVVAPGFVAGRVQYWKGPTVLCEAQAQLGNDAPRIDWAGRDMDYRSSDQSMSEYLEREYPDTWRHSVRPIGQIPRREVLYRQAAAEFVVVPSIWDVFNYTTVEAMRAGSVVICSEGAGAADLIEDGENGFRVPAEDPAALAQTIKTVRTLSQDKRECMGAAARKKINEALDPSRIAQRRVETFRDLGRHRGAGSQAEWLVEAVRPGGRYQVPSKQLAFLDHLPLRDLTRYVVRRMRRKLRTVFE